MLTELEGKGGCVCEPARKGELKCPLIVRPTSEDVITGELFGALQGINPRRWLPQIVNHALGESRFQQQVFRGFQIELWHSRSPYPKHLLPWAEGSTQVDVTIRWENPPTTIFFEVKYLSDLSPRTSGDDGSSGYPSDQLIRNIRVGLLECGWFNERRLFPIEPRDFAIVLLRPQRGHPLVSKYRDRDTLLASIPCSEQLTGLPAFPFVGELTFAELAEVLKSQQRLAHASERRQLVQLITYLEFKSQRAALGRSACQEVLAS